MPKTTAAKPTMTPNTTIDPFADKAAPAAAEAPADRFRKVITVYREKSDAEFEAAKGFFLADAARSPEFAVRHANNVTAKQADRQAWFDAARTFDGHAESAPIEAALDRLETWADDQREFAVDEMSYSSSCPFTNAVRAQAGKSRRAALNDLITEIRAFRRDEAKAAR